MGFFHKTLDDIRQIIESNKPDSFKKAFRIIQTHLEDEHSFESELSDLQRVREQVNAEFETRYLQAKSVLEKAYEEAQSIMKRK